MGLRRLPKVPDALVTVDQLGALKVRVGIGRYDYLVEPGLYALGNPTATAPVFVTANYKLSFDKLRASLTGLDCLILVLQTMGINVWCAAGKGSFGTKELCERIELEKLSQVVSHKEIIVPQLGAPGIAAHEVKKTTGFKVIYGPVQASDLKAFLANGHQATAEMRRKRFPLFERIELIPLELLPALKLGLPLALVLSFIGALASKSTYANGLLTTGGHSFLSVFLAVTAGTILTPIFLPIIPARAFSAKGLIMGLCFAVPILLLVGFEQSFSISHGLIFTGNSFVALAIASFGAMNFTGSSTYTSFSGVRKEMRIAVPLQATGFILGITIWALGLFIF